MMRRLVALIVMLIMTFTLCGCGGDTKKSDADARMEAISSSARQAEERAREAQQEYDNLQNDLDEYNRLHDALENAK